MSKNSIVVISSLFLVLILAISSCGTAKNSGGRKCDGKKGQKTPMGLI